TRPQPAHCPCAGMSVCADGQADDLHLLGEHITRSRHGHLLSPAILAAGPSVRDPPTRPTRCYGPLRTRTISPRTRRPAPTEERARGSGDARVPMSTAPAAITASTRPAPT